MKNILFSKIVFIASGLVFIVGILYLVLAAEEAAEASEEQAAALEAVFFSITGIAYIAVGIWMIKSNIANKYPYMIALVGSIALIIFYIISRTVSLPVVGQEEEVGAIDIATKVLQIAIIGISAYIISSGRAIRKADLRP